MWTITGAVVAPHLPSHGFCASLDEAKAKFAETWRKWLALETVRKTRCMGATGGGSRCGNWSGSSLRMAVDP
jgi:hypothetical protein